MTRQNPRSPAPPGMPCADMLNTAVSEALPHVIIAERPGTRHTMTCVSGRKKEREGHRPMAEEKGHATLPAESGPEELTCPACGGPLREILSTETPQAHDEDLVHYRCLVGHTYTGGDLLAAQSAALVASLRATLGTLEEKVAVARRLAEQAEQARRELLSAYYQAQDAEQRASLLRQTLLDGQDGETPKAN